MPKICAELGHNANGNIKLAIEMIKEAKECGADVAKFQFYRINDIKKPFQSRYFELWAAEWTNEEIKKLIDTCQKVGIEFLASAFNPVDVWLLKKYGVLSLKLASRSVYDQELISAMEKTKLPIIASLGKWDKKEFPKIKNAQFLYCIAKYPAPDGLPNDFERYDGISDHSLGLETAKEAIRRGAKIIEKHFTLSKQLPGYNQAMSIEPYELKELCNYARRFEN